MHIELDFDNDWIHFEGQRGEFTELAVLMTDGFVKDSLKPNARSMVVNGH